jgi:flagellin-like hook-associated protein FlgL
VSSVISNQNTNVTNIQTTLNNVVNLDIAQATSQEQEQSLQEQALTSFAAGLQRVPLIDIIA